MRTRAYVFTDGVRLCVQTWRSLVRYTYMDVPRRRVRVVSATPWTTVETRRRLV